LQSFVDLPSGTANSVNVLVKVLLGDVVVDDQRDLVNIDTTSHEIGGDQNSAAASSEFVQNDVTLLLVNQTVL
jgi:hypothetical protein